MVGVLVPAVVPAIVRPRRCFRAIGRRGACVAHVGARGRDTRVGGEGEGAEEVFPGVRAAVAGAVAGAVVALASGGGVAWAGPVEDLQASRAQPGSVGEVLRNVVEDNVELNKERAQAGERGLFADEVREDTVRVVLEDDLIASNIVGDLFTLFRWQLAAILLVTGVSGLLFAKKQQDDGDE